MGWRDTSFRIYWWLEKRIAPELRYAQYDYEETLFKMVPEGAKWLDIGCGHQILPEWRHKQEQEIAARASLVVGLDYDRPSLLKHRTISARIQGDIRRLPFRENTFDIVTANMVVEHLYAPEEQFKEIERVLKPGGAFVFHTPNYYCPIVLTASLVPDRLKRAIIKILEGRKDEDIFPAYYKANTEKDIKRLSVVSGFIVEEIKLITSGGHALFALFPPISVLELLYLKVIKRYSWARHLRSNIISVLRKPKTVQEH